MINTKATAKFTNDLDEEDHVELLSRNYQLWINLWKVTRTPSKHAKEAADLMDMKASVEITFTDVFEETPTAPGTVDYSI